MKYFRHYILILFLIGFAYAQQTDPFLTGKVLPFKGNIENFTAHIINLNTKQSTILNSEKKFRIQCNVSDTLLISSIGFESKKIKITEKHFYQENINIFLKHKIYVLPEVVLNPYNLTGNFEVDVKNLYQKEKKPFRVPGYKTIEDLGFPKPKKPHLFQIVDFLYDIFGDKPEQLRKLKSLKRELELEMNLSKKLNPKSLMRIFKISHTELDKIFKGCNISTFDLLKNPKLDILQKLINWYNNLKKDK